MEIICSKTESLMIKRTDNERMMSGYKIRNIQTQIEIPLAFCRKNDCMQINQNHALGMDKDTIFEDSIYYQKYPIFLWSAQVGQNICSKTLSGVRSPWF